MNLFPIKQKELFGLESQIKEITNLFKDSKLPSKILLSGPKGSGKATFAYHIINYIFSQYEENKYNLNNCLIKQYFFRKDFFIKNFFKFEQIY